MKRTTLCILLVVLPMVVMAQYYGRHRVRWRPTLADYDEFKCDSSKAKFGSVNKCVYLVKDSILHTRKLVSKLIARFDTNQENIFEMSADSNLHVTDSIRHVYDGKDNLLRVSSYALDDSTHLMYKSNEEVKQYNSRYKVIKDSEYSADDFRPYELRMKKKEKGDKRTRKRVSCLTYQNDTNEIKSIIITVNGTLLAGDDRDSYDTTIYITKYDDKGRVVYTEELGGWSHYRQYHKYDSWGNSIFYAMVGTDSSYTKDVYDNRGYFIETSRYTNGHLEFMDSLGRNAEGLRTETEEEVTSEVGAACTNSTVTVKIYDKSHRVISNTATKMEDGVSEVITTIDKYTTDNRDNVLLDSTFFTKEGFLHSMTSEEVYQYKYDEKGNKIWYSVIGGGTYSNNFSEIWKYDELRNVIYNARYSSCVPDKPEKETINTYYPGGGVLKEIIEINEGKKSYTYYDEEGKIIKELSPPDEDNDNAITETDYTYTK